jgi:hypothetical protein
VNRNRIAVWSTVIVSLLLIGWLTWFLLSIFFSPAQPKPPANTSPATFFPITSPGITPPPAGTDSGEDPNARRVVPRLRQLSDAPTAGMVAFDDGGLGSTGGLPRASVTVFRWIDRATGHIYEARENDSTKTRVSNTTIPGVQEGFFSKDGKSVVARYLRADNETVETLVGQIESVTEKTSNGYVYNETRLVSRHLQPNILAAGDAPGEDAFYILTENPTGGSVLSVGRYSTGTPIAIFQSPLAQWAVSWSSTTLALRTKADSETDGYLFFVDLDADASEKVIEDRQGLTTSINPAGTYALFSETVDNDLRLWLKDLKTGEERLLELRTLPEKCAWDPVDEATVYCGAPDFYVRGPYPTNWYQGRFSFDDNIWRIDVDRENYDLLYDTRVGEETFDVWRPVAAPDGGHLLFLNKRDLTLWALDVNAEVPQSEGGAAGAEPAPSATI